MPRFVAEIFKKFSLSINRGVLGLVWGGGGARVSKKQKEAADSFVEKIGFTKTLWSMDNSIHIKEFFCLPKLAFNDIPSERTSISSFSVNKNIIIGPAGQGKSIFLRYLCIEELENQDFIPIFFELRKVNFYRTKNVDKGSLLKRCVDDVFDSMGIATGDEHTQNYLSSGRFALMLDGFDELTSDNQSFMAEEINYYAQKYQDLPIFVTTRPSTELIASPFFSTHHMCRIGRYEIDEIVGKLSTNAEQKKAILDAIGKNKNVGRILETPLLVVILVIVYKSYNEIPATLADFYEDLFIVLLRRHDNTKAGFNRERLSTLDDSEIRKIFDIFCYLSAIDNHVEMTMDYALKISQKSMSKVLIEGKDPSHFFNDIVKITNLIIRDGRVYKFPHKTIQEYFSAKYVSGFDNKRLNDFYTALMNSKRMTSEWRKQIEFLSEIEPLKYKKYYVLPSSELTGVFVCRENDCVFNPDFVLNMRKFINFKISLNVSIDKERGKDGVVRKEKQKMEWYYVRESFSFIRFRDTYSEIYKKLADCISSAIIESLEYYDMAEYVGDDDFSGNIKLTPDLLTLPHRELIGEKLESNPEYDQILKSLLDDQALLKRFDKHNSVVEELKSLVDEETQ